MYNKLIVFIVLLCACFSVQAQTDLSNVDLFTDQSGSNCTIKAVFTDVTNLEKIRVVLGSENNQNDLANYDFQFDIISGLPAGFSYNRTDNVITLNIAVASMPTTVFGNISYMLKDGTWSSVYQIISN